jgi:hypothetical protein
MSAPEPAADLPGPLPRRRDGLRLRRDGDRNILVDDDGAEVGALNETALALWELCDGQTRPEEIIIAVCEAFAVPRPTAEEDVDRTLRELAAAGLLQAGPVAG